MSFGQGGPSWGGPEAPGHDPYGSQTPDWAALADASAARARRRRWLLVGAGALATGVVGAAVAAAVVLTSGGDDSRAAEKNPATRPPAAAPQSPAGEPAPSFSPVAPLPPPDAKDFISSADKDRAPLSAGTLFPGAELKVSGRVYQKGPTSRTTNCASAAQKTLVSTLATNSCDQVIRATYRKGGVAVTVGVAVFADESRALKAKAETDDGIASLSGSGIPTFCRDGAVCRMTTNSYGRYVYFTVGGFLDGRNVAESDQDVYTLGDDVAEFTFRQIVRRGQAQAAAAAAALR